jgi:hypothetical protein
LLDELFQRLGIAFQFLVLLPDLPPKLSGVESTMQRRHEVHAIKGFLNEVIGSCAQGLSDHGLISMTSDKQRGDIWMHRRDLSEQFQSIYPGHFDIADDSLIIVLLKQGKGLVCRLSGIDTPARQSQGKHVRKRLKQRWIIINQKNMWGRHGIPPLSFERWQERTR